MSKIAGDQHYGALNNETIATGHMELASIAPEEQAASAVAIAIVWDAWRRAGRRPAAIAVVAKQAVNLVWLGPRFLR
jgi:hypothetical protein